MTIFPYMLSHKRQFSLFHVMYRCNNHAFLVRYWLEKAGFVTTSFQQKFFPPHKKSIRRDVTGNLGVPESARGRNGKEKRSEIYRVNNSPTSSHSMPTFCYGRNCIKDGRERKKRSKLLYFGKYYSRKS